MKDHQEAPVEPGADDPVCVTQRIGATALVWINDPKRRNPLSMALRPALIQAMADAQADPEVRAVVLAGAGGCFSAGGDISTMKGITAASGRARLQDVHRLVKIVQGGTRPVIAAVEGYAVGAGLSIAAMCDMVVASSEAKFSLPFGKLGLMPDLGVFHTLPARIGMGRTKLLAMTGRTIDAQTAADWGIVEEICAPGEAVEKALAMAEEVARCAPLSVATSKQTLARGPMSLDDMLSAEADTQALLFCTDDVKEGVAAFLEKRRPDFKGA